MTAREEILGRIRAAAVPMPVAAAEPPAYRRVWQEPADGMLPRLIQRLRDYGVTVLQAATEAEVAAAAAARLAELGVGSLVVPADLPAAWRPRLPGLVEDTGQDAPALDRIAGVMTGCALAVAETGTIVLDAGAAQGRRALTLVPDYCLCVVLATQVVGLVPEAVTRLHAAAAAGRPITFISGPSATADIELNRVAGVHGPRRLDMILVGS
jgi:L-lactate dehydrogenase complex protein LldG